VHATQQPTDNQNKFQPLSATSTENQQQHTCVDGLTEETATIVRRFHQALSLGMIRLEDLSTVRYEGYTQEAHDGALARLAEYFQTEGTKLGYEMTAAVHAGTKVDNLAHMHWAGYPVWLVNSVLYYWKQGYLQNNTDDMSEISGMMSFNSLNNVE